MKLLFEFPRFHTNNVGMVNALIDDGHEVVFSVVRQSDIEDHSRIKPVHHKQSLASKVYVIYSIKMMLYCHFTFRISVHTFASYGISNSTLQLYGLHID